MKEAREQNWFIVNNTGAVIQPLDLIHSFFTRIQVINYDFEFNLEFIYTSVFFKKYMYMRLMQYEL